MTLPIDRIVSTLPSSLFRNFVEEMDAAFMEAARFTEQKFDLPERRATLPQVRHSLAERGFRSAATQAGLVAHAPDTEPLGGRYSLISHSGIFIIRGNIQKHCGLPRATSFRKEWAQMNEWLSPQQVDFFVDRPTPPPDRLCAMLVVTSGGKGSDPAAPAFVGMGVPDSAYSTWLFLEPINKIISRYHDLETTAKAPKEALIEIRDRAVPKLKRRDDKPNE